MEAPAQHVDAAYTFPVEHVPLPVPLPLSSPVDRGGMLSVTDTHGEEQSFPVATPRAGSIVTPQSLTECVAGNSCRSSAGGTPPPQHGGSGFGRITSRGSLAGSTTGKRGTPPSIRDSPAAHRSLVTYVQGIRGSEGEAARSPLGDPCPDDEEAAGSGSGFGSLVQRARSLADHSRRRQASLTGGSVSTASSIARSGTPQLMYRQDCVEEVVRQSPVATTASSRCSTPRLRSRFGSAAVPEGVAAHIGSLLPHLTQPQHQPQRLPVSLSPKLSVLGANDSLSENFTLPSGVGGYNSSSTVPFHSVYDVAARLHEQSTGTSQGRHIGVSTPEMAEYFADIPTHKSNTYNAEKSVSGTFVMNRCLKSIQEQADVIKQLLAEVQTLQSRNRLLEERVLRLELADTAARPQLDGRLSGGREGSVAVSGAASQWNPARTAGGKEVDGGGNSNDRDEATEPAPRWSVSPSAPRVSDTLSDEATTRAPSKAVER